MTTQLGLNSTLEHISDRIKDPFLGAYSFLFILINWKIFLNLFNSSSTEWKIQEIEKLIIHNNYQSFWGPLIMSLLFFVVTPLLRTFVRFILEILQRLDNYIVRIPMDKDKISVIEKNTKLVAENAILLQDQNELIRGRSLVHYYLAQNTKHVTDINNSFSGIETHFGDTYPGLKEFIHSAHQLANAYTNLKNNDDTIKLSF